MAVKCPQCGAEYDVTLFTFGRRMRCDCGAWVDLADLLDMDQGHTISCDPIHVQSRPR